METDADQKLNIRQSSKNPVEERGEMIVGAKGVKDTIKKKNSHNQLNWALRK